MGAYRLAVDEIALVLAQLGDHDRSRALLLLDAEQPNADVLRGRLLAAGHTLIARGLLDVDAVGAVTIDPGLADAVRLVGRPGCSVRADRSAGEDTGGLTFHFGSGGVALRHTTDRGVVHELEPLTPAEAAAALDAFLRLPAPGVFESEGFELPSEALDALQQHITIEALEAALADYGVPAGPRQLFAADFRDVDYRAGVTRIDYDADASPRSDEGMLLLRGPARLWVANIVPAGESSVLHFGPAPERLVPSLLRLAEVRP